MALINTRGRCLCGQTEIAVEGTPLRMAQCHCRDCQKASGTGHMSLVFLKEGAVKIDGELKGYEVTADSGNLSTRFFCPECGSRMLGKNTGRPGIVAVPVGVLDDRSWFTSQAVVYCKNRDHWDVTDKSIPNFEAMPPA